MNHVFLSGTAATAPKMVSQGNETAHAVMELTVTHRTAAGVEKREQYPISAWHGTARRMAELVTPGSRMSVKGYLSQKQTAEGIFLEVTVEEFQLSAYAAVRPQRRSTAPFRPPAAVSGVKKEAEPGSEQSAETVSGFSDSEHDRQPNQG